MECRKYGNYIICFDDDRVISAREYLLRMDVQKLESYNLSNGIIEFDSPKHVMSYFLFEDSGKIGIFGFWTYYSGDWNYALMEIEEKWQGLRGKAKVSDLNMNSVMACAQKSHSVDAILRGEYNKCGRRRLRRLFGDVEINEYSPFFADYSGQINDLIVNGVYLGYSFYIDGLRYLLSNERLHIASRSPPKYTLSVLDKKRKKYPREELVGTINEGWINVRARRYIGDIMVDVVLDKTVVVPKWRGHELEVTEKSVTPNTIDDVFEMVKPFVESVSNKITYLRLSSRSFFMKSDVGYVKYIDGGYNTVVMKSFISGRSELKPYNGEKTNDVMFAYLLGVF